MEIRFNAVPTHVERDREEFTQIVIGIKGKHQGPLIMVMKEWHRLELKDFGKHVDYGSVLWSSDWLWRRPLGLLKRIFAKKKGKVNEPSRPW